MEIKKTILEDLFSENSETSPYGFLIQHGKFDVADHSMKVSMEAKRLAVKFGEDSVAAEVAGLFHDISNVISSDNFIEVAKWLGINIRSEEETVPMLLHQKISSAIASRYFKIDNQEVLSAIACHTTLKAKATKFELLLFVADKLTWDSEENKVLVESVRAGLEDSLEQGAFNYLSNNVWMKKHELKVLHPAAEEAYFYLKEIIKK